MLRPNNAFLVQSSVLLALGLLATLLFTWPIVQIAGDRGTLSFFVYIFLVWAGLVLLLGRIGVVISRSTPAGDDSVPAIPGNKDNQG
jgi:hypothetical protein